MKLVSNAGKAHRMYVMQVLAVIALVQGVWASLPAELIASLPPGLVHYVTAALAVIGMVVRVIKQFSDGFEDTQPMAPVDNERILAPPRWTIRMGQEDDR
jgi:hypothetical protein